MIGFYISYVPVSLSPATRIRLRDRSEIFAFVILIAVNGVGLVVGHGYRN